MNMDMNMDNIIANKKVTFEVTTKVIDGTSVKNEMYYKFIDCFLKSKIKSPEDVSKYVEHDRSLLGYFLVQVLITLMKLRIMKKRKTIHVIKPLAIVKEHDEEEKSLILKWDTILLNMITIKKCNKDGVGVMRNGSRDYGGSFCVSHIPYLSRLAIMLIKARKIQ